MRRRWPSRGRARSARVRRRRRPASRGAASRTCRDRRPPRRHAREQQVAAQRDAQADVRARTAASAATRPAFMSHAPAPEAACRRRPGPRRRRARDHAAGSPIGTTSTWPLSISVPPPPARQPADQTPGLRALAPRRRGSPAPRAARRAGCASGRPRGRSRLSSRASLAWISCSGSVPLTLGMRTSSASRAKVSGSRASTSASTRAPSRSSLDYRRAWRASRRGRPAQWDAWRASRRGRPQTAGPPPPVECAVRPQALPRMRLSLVPQTGQMP